MRKGGKVADDEVNRKLEVVADHLAALAVGQEKAERRLDRLERIVKLAVRAGLRERRGRREQDDRITALVDAQMRTDDRIITLVDAQTHSNDRITALVDAQMRTDDRINAVVNVQTRADDRIAVLVDAQTRLETITRKNSESIGQLAEIVKRLATNKNGNGHDGAREGNQ